MVKFAALWLCGFLVLSACENQQVLYLELEEFSGEYALPEGDSPVRVIVLYSEAGSHEGFRQELDELFAGTGLSYELGFLYETALRGASLRLPASLVPQLLTFESVQSVHPDYQFQIDDPIEGSLK